MNPQTSPIVVVLFTLEGCPACEEYKPRFEKIAAAYKDRFPIVRADANDEKYADLAERLQVSSVPVTYVLRRPTGLIKVEGSVPDSQIAWLLNIAAREAATRT